MFDNVAGVPIAHAINWINCDISYGNSTKLVPQAECCASSCVCVVRWVSRSALERQTMRMRMPRRLSFGALSTLLDAYHIRFVARWSMSSTIYYLANRPSHTCCRCVSRVSYAWQRRSCKKRIVAASNPSAISSCMIFRCSGASAVRRMDRMSSKWSVVGRRVLWLSMLKDSIAGTRYNFDDYIIPSDPFIKPLNILYIIIGKYYELVICNHSVGDFSNTLSSVF